MLRSRRFESIALTALDGVVFALALWLALRARSWEAAWGLMLCVSVLASPVVWEHYLLILVPVFVWSVRALGERTVPREVGALAFLVAVLLFVQSPVRMLSMDLVSTAVTNDRVTPVTSWLALLPLLSILAVAAAALMVWRLDRLPPRAAGAPSLEGPGGRP